MSKVIFNEEQIKALKDNPYVKNVSEKAITYTDEFKEEFMKLYLKKFLPRQIFAKLGFDTSALGERRISTAAERIKKKYKEGKGFEDNRKMSLGRPRTRKLSKDEEIKKLKHKIKYQEQQIEYFKKITFVDKKSKWESRKKNTK